MSTHVIVTEVTSRSQQEPQGKGSLVANDNSQCTPSMALVQNGWHIETDPDNRPELLPPSNSLPSDFSLRTLVQPVCLESRPSCPPQSPTWRTFLSPRAMKQAKLYWPEPELSIGLPCAPLGRNKCWETIGPARNIASGLFRLVKDLLDQHSEHLHETEPVPFSIMFGLYMIGRSKSKASPTLLFSCEPKCPRQRAMKLVKETGILQGYPGVLLAESSRSPTIAGLVRPLGSVGAVDGDFIYFTPPAENKVCGLPIHVIGRSEPGSMSISQKATLGGFVRLTNSEQENLYCGLTVAHALEDGLDIPTVSGDIDFSFDGEDDDSDLESDTAETQVPVTNTSSSFSLSAHQDTTNEDESYFASHEKDTQYGIGNILASSLNGDQPDLDWALIQIDQPHTQQANKVSIDSLTGKCSLFVEKLVTSPFTESEVLVVTRRGVVAAKLSASSTFYKSAYSNSFEEVWAVKLDGEIGRGDSGSWVIDPVSGNLYGHIIAGCPESQVGYLIPAKRIFSDIRRQLGGTLQLASRNSNLTALPSGAASTMASCWQGNDSQRLAPLGTNQTEDEVLRHVGMSKIIFDQMDEDARRLYENLVFSGESLKPHVVKLPLHITWNDIDDKSKYEAMMILATDGTIETQTYWDMGGPDQDGPNWIAKWFLHRQFKKSVAGGSTRHSEAHTLDLDYIFQPTTARLRQVPVVPLARAARPLPMSVQGGQPPDKCCEYILKSSTCIE